MNQHLRQLIYSRFFIHRLTLCLLRISTTLTKSIKTVRPHQSSVIRGMVGDLNPQLTQTTNCEQSSVNSNGPTQFSRGLKPKGKTLLRSDCSLVSVKNRYDIGKFSYWFLTGWGLFWVLTWIILVSTSGQALSQTLPLFNQLTFDNLPSVSQSGSITVSPEVQGQVDYNLSRTWQKGQSIDSFLKLGDFQNSFQLQQLTLNEIEKTIGQSIANLPLSNFELLRQQTLGKLLTIIPQLENKTLSQIPLIQDLLKAQGYQISSVLNQPLKKLTKQNPKLNQLSLNQLDLSQYTFDDLPGLTSVALEKFTGWQNVSLASIPGLSSLPFANFPNPPQLSGGIVAKIDWVLSDVEQPANKTISGSDRLGYNVSCQSQCAHIELGDNPVVAGQQWVSGKYQSVEGGHGFLSGMFNGVEPTGRHPFGPGFKVVVWDIDEVTGTVSTAWFFRVCQKGLFNLSCSPYGIGPIPAFTYKENDWIFLGP